MLHALQQQCQSFQSLVHVTTTTFGIRNSEHSRMFHTRSTLIEDINFIVSRIVRLNSKLGNLRREHHEDRGSLPSDKTSVIRCTKCEGYGHENYQCPNWNGKYMTLQELQDYIVYLKEVKRSVGQKLEVRQEQQAKRDHEKAERTLKEIWEKARQERELKERKEEELREFIFDPGGQSPSTLIIRD
ncbi:uncharacterized protein LOC114180592 [Vigna unguiculata]|uniref:uncharacterized protein LOC114180592 n=1 Tax=Vigna unguiculata TaxID=3917 RepID=UPI0010167D88|nr:uncharacterized protein LOC114180592 [Vigna unguiculata]